MQSRKFLTVFWRLTRPYWFSSESRKGVLLLASVVALALGLVWLEVQFNAWNNDFYNAIQEKNADQFWLQLRKFGVLALAFIVAGVYKLYLTQMLQIEWRTWLTERYLSDWLAGRAYYRLQVADIGADNPDQRIAEDLRIFVDTTLSLSLGLLSAVVTLVSFVAILWVLSGPLTLPIGDGITVPGYMVWVALLYALAGTWLTHRIGRPLVGLEFNQQRYEADFRFALVRLRENAEGVALYRGEAGENENFRGRFGSVIGNWWSIMRKQKQLTWFTSGYQQIAIIFPFVVAAPRYFSGSIALGGLMQTASAFNQVQGALSWFIGAYTQFATWKATVDRLTSFTDALDAARRVGDDAGGRRDEAAAEGVIEAQGLGIALPGGRSLISEAGFSLKAGENVLLTGPSGAGKSSLFRVLAGIWPYWRGRLAIPAGAKLLFLPQKPYLPVGTLKHAVAYPLSAETVPDEAAQAALRAVGLVDIASDLARHENWAQVLSGGEQQRLAFARALINKPDWLFLDEASAALPEGAQNALYALLRERLPQTTLVSIAHRESLAQFHSRRLRWEVNPEGAPRLTAG